MRLVVLAGARYEAPASRPAPPCGQTHGRCRATRTGYSATSGARHGAITLGRRPHPQPGEAERWLQRRLIGRQTCSRVDRVRDPAVSDNSTAPDVLASRPPGFARRTSRAGELRAARDQLTPRRVERQAPRSTAVSTSRVLEDLHATRRVTIRASRPRPDRRRGQTANPRSQTAQAVARAEALMTQKPRDLLAVCRSTRLRETCKAHLACRDRRVALTAVAATTGSALAAEPEWGHCISSNQRPLQRLELRRKGRKEGQHKGKFEWAPTAAVALLRQEGRQVQRQRLH